MQTNKYTLSNLTSIGQKRKIRNVKNLFEYFLPRYNTRIKILEIGPGHGDFARECQRRDMDYLGIEPSQELRKGLEMSGIPVVDHTVPPIPFGNNEYDLVHSFDVIEHFCSYREVMDFFLELFRVLKPGGYISVIAPNYVTIKNIFFKYEYQHSYITTPERISNIFRRLWFQD